MDRVMHPSAALDTTGSRAWHEGQIRTLAPVTDIVRRMLGVIAVYAELDLDTSRCEERCVIRSEIGQEEIVSEVAAHVLSPSISRACDESAR
jgi:hypothetical protein